MRLNVFFAAALFAAPLIFALPAQAQDGAPQPLAMAAYEPEGYVPLPPGPIDMPALEGEDDFAIIEEPLPEIAEALPESAPPRDPITLCREQAGADFWGRVRQDLVDDCLADRHKQSVAALERASSAAQRRVAAQGRDAVRALARSNMNFIASRDSECLRQKNAAGNAQDARRTAHVCHATLNEMHSRILNERL